MIHLHLTTLKGYILAYLPFTVADSISYLWHYSHYKGIKDKKSSYGLKPFINKKCLFVHIPKCGGTSITKSMFGNLGGGHLTIRDYKFIFSKNLFNRVFKFTFVRNPIHRLVSSFLYLKSGGGNKGDEAWAYKNIRNYESVNEFVHEWLSKKSIWLYPHFRPQYYYICDSRQKIAVDFIGRVENIENDFGKVCEKVGVECHLEHFNKTNTRHQDYRDLLWPSSVEKIKKVYSKDFSLLEY